MKRRKAKTCVRKQKKSRSAYLLEKIAVCLVKFLPEKMTGSKNVLKRKVKIVVDPVDVDNAVDQERLKNAKRYSVLFLIGGMLLIFTFFTSLDGGALIDKISRPEPGEGRIHVPVKVNAKLDGVMVEQEAELTIQERVRTKTEEILALNQLAEQLPALILGSNSNLNHISYDLNLIEKDEATGTTIRWETERPDLVDEKGNVYLLNLIDSEEEIALIAYCTAGSTSRKISFSIVIVDNPLSYELGLKRQISLIIGSVNKDRSSNLVQLPDQVGKGVSMRWASNEGNAAGVVILFLLIAALYINGTKYSSLDRKERLFKEAIRREFPAFMDKLVLLLNAGLTALAALEKIADDYSNSSSPYTTHVLYNELQKIQRKVKESNVSIIHEWRIFGIRTEINEILRFCTILENNINKGSELADKLESEGQLLWNNRKKKAEEKGRMVETKMIVPMILLLAALIIVTISPAMLEM